MRNYTKTKTAAALAAILAIGALAACSGGEDKPVEKEAEVTAPAITTIADMVAHERRSESDRARDQFRHPAETLEFFEVGPKKTVAEIWPGWYSDIIAPYVAANDGRYVAVLLPSGVRDGWDARNNKFKAKYADTETFGTVQYGHFAKGDSQIAEPGSVDVLLTFRNVHNWMRSGYGDQAFSDFYTALKPGGILGVVEHRLPESAVQNPLGESGYVQESYMKDMAARAGFEFVARSDINANPLDTADHPLGVWTLPPRSRAPKEGSPEAEGFDAEKYKNIGESDRATLKFRKPN